MLLGGAVLVILLPHGSSFQYTSSLRHSSVQIGNQTDVGGKSCDLQSCDQGGFELTDYREYNFCVLGFVRSP